LYRDDSEWEVEDSRDGHAAIATAISSALLLLSTCSRPAPMAPTGPEGLGYALGGIAAAVALFWGIPYWITIRKASRRWKIGSFVTIAVLAVLSNLWLIGSANERTRAGFKEQSRQAQEIAEGKRTRLEATADADPLQKFMVEVANRNIADLEAYGTEMEAAGGERIALLSGLQSDSAELRNCAKFTGLAAKARSNSGKLDTYLADVRPKLDQEVSNGTITQESASEFMAGAMDSKPKFVRTWELQAQYAEAVEGLCQVLARKNWRVQRGQAAFTNEADLAAANAQLDKIRQIGAEQQRMKAETVASMQ